MESNYPRPIKEQKGFNLIELMISMLLGFFVIEAVTQTFIRTAANNPVTYQLGLMHDTARIAMSAIASDARMAGYTGCNSNTAIGNALQENSQENRWATGEKLIQGLNILDSQSEVDANAISESLLIFKLDSSLTFQINSHDTSTAALTLDRSANDILTAGMPVGLVRQDCSQLALVGLSAVNGSNVSHQASNSGNFNNCFTVLKGSFRCYDSSTSEGVISFFPGSLKPMQPVAYYIQDDNNLPTLFRKEAFDGSTQAIVDGIEDIRFHFGLDIDDNGVADRFIRAGERGFRHEDWSKVTAIRIHLLTRSETELIPDPAITPLTPRTYLFDGVNVSQSDRFLRREYVQTIALRNTTNL